MALFTARRDAGGGEASVTAAAATAASVGPVRADTPENQGRSITLQAADGQVLAAHWHARLAEPGRGTVVLASATGVPQSFYLRFAQWLTAQGVDVLRFDFRGIAASRPARLRGFVADFSHWTMDLDAALGFALAQGTAPVSLVGHSIGGFLAPVAPLATRLHRLVLVGAQSAYWRDFPHPQRWPMAALWHGLLPVVTSLVGYFPARALRMGEDLPRGVALQWALRPWRDPFDIEQFSTGYARALPPVHLVAANDDPFATPAALARVASRLTAAPPRTHLIAAGTEGPKRIGHFGLFRSACGEQVWPRLLELALPRVALIGGAGPRSASIHRAS